ncbi:MAG: dephospho-CoA kinase [Desulfomonile sp.]|jgi:dephospho-CoA kinase|nr:dephospho-CoA kinase [Deltaproteobacteria bacterium]
MLVVGLTGGISSGKSTVSAMFRQAGVPVICADELAHEVVKPRSPALEDIRRVFGDEILDADGVLDRVVMARLIFKDTSKRRMLESIIHPRVSEEKNRRIAEFEQQGLPFVVVDVPLLYEAAWEKNFDVVIVVYVPREIQEKRLAERDNMSAHEIRSRVDSQMAIEDKRKRADMIVDNTGSLDYTRLQVENIMRRLSQMADLKKKAAPQSLNSEKR